MSRLKLEKVRKFINENNATFNVPHNLLCTLCGKLIIISKKAPCDCKFCEYCITTYLKNEDKNCCGNTRNCKMIKLNLSRDIKEDMTTNNEIQNLIIHCSSSTCQYSGNIFDLCNHSSVCGGSSQNNNSNKIPLIWGCEIGQGFQSPYDKIVTNNSNEIKKMKLTIDNMKSEKKSEIENLKRENKLHTDEIKRLTSLVTKMEAEMNDLKLAKRQHNKDLDHLNKSNAELRKTVNKSTNEMKEFKSGINNQAFPVIDPLKEKIEKMDKEMTDLNTRFVKITKDFDKLRKSNTEFSSIISDTNTDVIQLSNQIDGLCFNFSVLACKVGNLEAKHSDLSEAVSDKSTCMFTWSVNNFTNYKTEPIPCKNRKLTSKIFHASDKSYKIHFDLYPYGYGDAEGEFLSMFAVIKMADKREWNGALLYDITVSISASDQKYGPKKLTKVVNNNQMVGTDIDHSVGIVKLIEICRIFEEPSLLDNNTLTFEFLVKRK